MTDSLRRVAIVGGSRIPFCRSNTMYADKSNLDMLSAALDGVVQRFASFRQNPTFRWEISTRDRCDRSI